MRIVTPSATTPPGLAGRDQALGQLSSLGRLGSLGRLCRDATAPTRSIDMAGDPDPDG